MINDGNKTLAVKTLYILLTEFITQRTVGP